MNETDPRTGPVEVVPRKQGWTTGDIVGVVVGGILLGATSGALIAYAIISSNGALA
ncbi:hypothetical protein SEA_ROBINROSE_72 [Microbacterium phage RobinRose]|nr:hypothetical protein SEA_ROBINROSE_72 [Microbacterium phage RobinRose]